MDRKELYRRSLQSEIRWDVGKAGCHDVKVVPTSEEFTPKPGEEYYVISVDPAGNLVTTPGTSE